MSVKGISWIEANFEKLIVVVMLLAFLAVLIFQFVLQSSAVEVGGNKVSLAKAFEPAERAAERLQSQINEPNPTLPTEIETRDLAEEFERAISGGVVQTESFLAIGEPLALEVTAGDIDFASGSYAPFQPPVPKSMKAASYRATLDPYAVESIEGLAEILPSESQPFDTPWVSVQGTFSGRDLKTAYERDPDGASGVVSPLPSSWWSEGVGVVTVEVERQRRDLDGNWGPAEVVQRMPGTMSLTEDLDETATNYRQLQTLGSQAARNEDVILRPEFISILEGEQWVPPVEVPDPSEVGDLKSQIKTLERRLAMIDRDIAQKTNALSGQTQTSNRRDNRDEREGGGGDADRRRESSGNTNSNQQQDAEQQDARKRNIQTQIDRLNEQRTDVEEQLVELGWQPSNSAGTTDAYDRQAYEHTKPLLETDEVNFWVHDLKVEPGATYRYRTRLVFVNPLYGRKSSLDESLHELADAKLVRSDWSDWSDPIGVSWDEYFFLTSASAPEIGNIGKTSATAELYRFYYGYWRKSEVSLEPGDRFVAEIKLPEGLQKWDTEREAEAQAWKPTPEGAEEPIVQVEGLSESLLPTTLPVSAEAWLLDVVASPKASVGINNQSKLTYEALVRGPDGRISSHAPVVDSSEPLLAVIKSSAELGASQLPRIPGRGPRQSLQTGFGGDREFAPSSDDARREESRRRREGGGGGGAGGG